MRWSIGGAACAEGTVCAGTGAALDRGVDACGCDEVSAWGNVAVPSSAPDRCSSRFARCCLSASTCRSRCSRVCCARNNHSSWACEMYPSSSRISPSRLVAPRWSWACKASRSCSWLMSFAETAIRPSREICCSAPMAQERLWTTTNRPEAPFSRSSLLTY